MVRKAAACPGSQSDNNRAQQRRIPTASISAPHPTAGLHAGLQLGTGTRQGTFRSKAAGEESHQPGLTNEEDWLHHITRGPHAGRLPGWQLRVQRCHHGPNFLVLPSTEAVVQGWGIFSLPRAIWIFITTFEGHTKSLP